MQNLLTRPELQAKYKSLTPYHVNAVLSRIRHFVDWIETPPKRFTLPGHEKDDHLFNLAIAAKASYLVTFEKRILALQHAKTAEARRLHSLAPVLEILDPPTFAKRLRPES